MDNFVPSLAIPCPNSGVHFGHLLRTLRLERGLTQAELGISPARVRSAEQAAECTFFAKTAKRVLESLTAISPLEPEQLRAFSEATGLKVASGQPMVSSSLDRTDPDRQSAHIWIDRMLDELGATRTLALLEGLAVASSLDLPPRIRADEMPRQAGVWAYIHPPQQHEDRTVHRLDPIKPPAPPAAPPARRKAV